MRWSATFVITLAACAPRTAAPPAPNPAPAPAATEAATTAGAISAAELRTDLFVFASDSFRGREAATPDANRAAQFIATRLAEIGVEPAGDSGFLQRVPMSRQGLGRASRFSVTTPSGTTLLPVGETVAPLLSLGRGAPLPKLTAAGDLVFAGYGVSLPNLKRDDLAGLDLRGKVAVVVNGAPAAVDSSTRAQLSSFQAVGPRLARLREAQPAAIIILLTGKAADEWPQYAAELRSGSVSLGDAPPAGAPRELPMILLGIPKQGSPLLPSGWPADDKAQPLRGRRFSGRIELGTDTAVGYNVVGVVRGRDPALGKSYVALGAHLDHIGVQAAVNGDSIANGADDDGSGSMVLLAIAKSLAGASQKPRRSVLFVWHTGEEKGLLGSEYFTSHPTVPLDSIVAQLNADMIGRNAPDSIYLVGPAAAPEGQSRVLGTIVDSVNASLERPFRVNREWDSPTHPEQIYFRSDHYSYAKHGVPIVFFTTGLHPDYHAVSDEPSKIDYDKLARVGNFMLQSALAVANRPTRPRSEASGATP